MAHRRALDFSASILGLTLCISAPVLLLALGNPARATAPAITEDSYGGRSMLLYLPAKLPAAGQRALVVVLHGGLGNASRIAYSRSESALNLDAAADKAGFVVAYLNGTPVTRVYGPDVLGWNAGGGCCGLSAERNVDDVDYIKGAVASITARYGIDPAHVYGIGHSNGAMMIERMMCESNVFAAAIAISGPLNLPVSSCPSAGGKHILAIHGAADQNVPVAGGQGTKGLSRATYASEDHTNDVFTRSGAIFQLQIVPGADHKLDHIDAAIEASEGRDIAEKAARFFGLAPP